MQSTNMAWYCHTGIPQPPSALRSSPGHKSKKSAPVFQSASPMDSLAIHVSRIAENLQGISWLVAPEATISYAHHPAIALHHRSTGHGNLTHSTSLSRYPLYFHPACLYQFCRDFCRKRLLCVSLKDKLQGKQKTRTLPEAVVVLRMGRTGCHHSPASLS